MANRGPVFLAAGGLALAVALYILPGKKVVVEDGDDVLEDPVMASATPSGDGSNAHRNTIPPLLRERIDYWRQETGESEVSKDYAIFADSLAEGYFMAGWYDSAAYYAEAVAKQKPEIAARLKAGEYHYEAFTFAIDANAQSYHSEKAQQYLRQVVDEEDDNLTAKAKLGMTYVSGPTPMTGILMLREVVETDPNHVLAQFNLGMLSRQTQQYDKAVERFEAVLKVEPENLQARFFLGLSYQEGGQTQKALKVYEDMLEQTDDPMVIETIQSAMRQL